MPAAVEQAVSDVGNLVTEALPVIGAVVGFIYGGPTGASIGYSLGKAGQGALKGGGGNSNTPAGFTASAQGRDQVIRSSVANRTVVYGRAMVSGPLVFGSLAGESNKYLWLVIPVAGHEIDAIESVYLNEIEVPLDGAGNVTSGPYAGKVLVKKHLGNPGDPADADLVAAGIGWTAAHRLTGVAHLDVRLEWSPDVFPTGIPNIKCVIRGRKVFDPRTGLTAWNPNTALCVRDYLISEHGLQASTSEIDTALVVAAANVCDEPVSLVGGGTEPRYTCNGVMDTGSTPREIMEAVLSSMAGFVVWSGGLYQPHAGAYTAPTVTLTADDLRGAVKVRPRMSRKELFNAVRGTFVDPSAYWQPTDFPTVSNATYAAQDGGQVIWRDAVLPYTTSSATAQRIAKLTLERSRQGITVELLCKLTAFRVSTMSTVRLDIAQLGWAGKEFKVLEWHFSPEGGVDLVLQEETAASYNWNSGLETVRDPAPDTNLGNPFDAPAPQGFALYSGTDALVVQLDGTVSARIRASWSRPSSQFVTVTEIEARKQPSTVWEAVAPVDATQGFGYITPVQDGALYDVRIRHRNTYGVRSAWVESLGHKVIGKTEPPSNVATLLVSGTTLTWPPVPDLDLAGYILKFQYGTNLDWGTASKLHEGIVTDSPYAMQTVPPGSITLMVRAVDTSGNESAESAYAITNLGDTPVANVVESRDFGSLGWPGVVVNGTVGGSYITSTQADLFFVDDAARFFGKPDTEQFYSNNYDALEWVSTGWTPSAVADGMRMTALLDISATTYRVDYRSTGPLPFFGNDLDFFFGADDAEFFSPPGAWTTWPGSITAGVTEYQWRVSTVGGASINQLRSFVVAVDVPDKTLRLDDVPVLAGGTRLTAAMGQFFTIQNVQLTLQGGSTAVSLEIADKSTALGPLIVARDAAGTSVPTTVDAFLQGY